MGRERHPPYWSLAALIFGVLGLVTALVGCDLSQPTLVKNQLGKGACADGGDKSPMGKAVTSPRTPKELLIFPQEFAKKPARFTALTS